LSSLSEQYGAVILENNTKFTKIGLIAKSEAPALALTLNKLYDFLMARHIEIFATENAAKHIPVDSSSLNTLGKECQLVIVVGGDGTLLSSARTLVDFDTPMVGINLGRLGFLVDISPNTLDQSLSAIIEGHYQEDSRFLLEASIDGQKPILAFNDVVIHKWNIARMIEFETWIDGNYVEAQRSDGVIISTPSGSTAYSLSGGGPLLEPSLDAISLVPICPHTLSNRPIVIHGDSEIRIKICGQTDYRDVHITCDGQESLELKEDSILTIKKYPRCIKLFHPCDHNHFKLLQEKLSWGGQHKPHDLHDLHDTHDLVDK